MDVPCAASYRKQSAMWHTVSAEHKMMVFLNFQATPQSICLLFNLTCAAHNSQCCYYSTFPLLPSPLHENWPLSFQHQATIFYFLNHRSCIHKADFSTLETTKYPHIHNTLALFWSYALILFINCFTLSGLSYCYMIGLGRTDSLLIIVFLPRSPMKFVPRV